MMYLEFEWSVCYRINFVVFIDGCSLYGSTFDTQIGIQNQWKICRKWGGLGGGYEDIPDREGDSCLASN